MHLPLLLHLVAAEGVERVPAVLPWKYLPQDTTRVYGSGGRYHQGRWKVRPSIVYSSRDPNVRVCVFFAIFEEFCVNSSEARNAELA